MTGAVPGVARTLRSAALLFYTPRMAALRLSLISMLLGVLACQPSPSEEASKEPPTRQEPAVEANGGFASAAQGLVRQFAEALQRELAAGIKAGGPPNAIGVCSVRAPSIADALSTEGLTIRRIGTRVRNARTNTPTDAEARILAKLTVESSTFSGQIAGNEVFMQAIFINKPVCLKCHGTGDEIAADTRAELAKRYPGDKAVGYKIGDLRGAFVVERAPSGVPSSK